jgi:hypothetical protein
LKRFLLLENNPALGNPGWLPPPAAWPELAKLHVEHQRLLAARHAEWEAWRDLPDRYEAEDEAHHNALKSSFLSGSSIPDDERDYEEARNTEVADALLRLEAATDALQTFLMEATAEIQRRAPEFYNTLNSRRAEADAKREQARRALAEAEAAVGETFRMRAWLDRESGKSALTHFPYADMLTPSKETLYPSEEAENVVATVA